MQVSQRKNFMDEFIKLLNQDAIYIPKKVLKHDDIYEETKIMFSIILTENREFINSKKHFPLSEVIEIYENVDLSKIKCECFCGEPKAKLIKQEMIILAEQLEDLLDIPLSHRSRSEK